MFGAIASIASAGLGFLGQRKANKDAKRAREHDQYLNSPQGIRDEAEAAGFNPLTVMNSGRSFGAGYAPQFGNELGQLGQGLVEAATGYEQLQIQRAELDMQQQRLEHLQKATTLGADVPGIYGARNAGTQKRSGRNSGTDNDAASVDHYTALRRERDSGGTRPDEYNPNVAPTFDAFGVNWTGSGAISGGETIEDSLGDGPASWIAAPLIAVDMFGHTIGQAVSRRQQKKADAQMDEWFRRSRENDPIKPKKPKKPKKKDSRYVVPHVSTPGFY